jgi:hypothetical protein
LCERKHKKSCLSFASEAAFFAWIWAGLPAFLLFPPVSGLVILVTTLVATVTPPVPVIGCIVLSGRCLGSRSALLNLGLGLLGSRSVLRSLGLGLLGSRSALRSLELMLGSLRLWPCRSATVVLPATVVRSAPVFEALGASRASPFIESAPNVGALWPAAVILAASAFAILPESVVPVPAVMSAVFHVTAPSDLIPVVPPDGAGKFMVTDTSPGSPIVVGPVPVPVAEDEIGIPEEDDVMGSAIGYRKSIVVHIDEIGSAFKTESRPPWNFDAYTDIRMCIGVRLNSKHSCDADGH